MEPVNSLSINKQSHQSQSSLNPHATVELRPKLASLIAYIALFAFLGVGCGVLIAMGPGRQGLSTFRWWFAVTLGTPAYAFAALCYLYLLIKQPVLVIIDQIGIRKRSRTGSWRLLPWELLDRVVIHEFKNEQAVELFASEQPLSQLQADHWLSRVDGKTKLVQHDPKAKSIRQSTIMISNFLIGLDIPLAINMITARLGPDAEHCLFRLKHQDQRSFSDAIMQTSDKQLRLQLSLGSQPTDSTLTPPTSSQNQNCNAA